MIVEEDIQITFPNQGKSKKIELKSNSFYFWIDINRKGNKLKKVTLQLREQSRKEIPLLRLDLLGPDHPNPEGDFELAGQIIPCPHLHIAHPDYGDSIAYPLDNTYANMYLTDEQCNDMVFVLQRFLNRCNAANIRDYSYNYQEELLN